MGRALHHNPTEIAAPSARKDRGGMRLLRRLGSPQRQKRDCHASLAMTGGQRAPSEWQVELYKSPSYLVEARARLTRVRTPIPVAPLTK